MTQQQRILVLGSTGKIGRMLGRYWHASKKTEFVLIGRKSSEDPKTWTLENEAGHLENVKTIIALWGVTSGDADALQMNAQLAQDAMELGEQIGASRVLHCSSAAIYQPQTDPLSETSTPAPGNPYGQSKLRMEQVVLNWAAQNPDGPKPCLMRVANVIGADSLFRGINGGDTITLDMFADGFGPRRSYLGIEDFAHILDILSNCEIKNLPDIVNVATPGVVGMMSLAQAAGCSVQSRPAPVGANAVVQLSVRRLLDVPNIELKTADAEKLVSEWRKWGNKA